MEDYNDNKLKDYGRELARWRVPEHDKYVRTRSWYIGAGIVAFLMLIFAFYTLNFLFAVIIIIVSAIIFWRDTQESEIVDVFLTTEGVIIGRKFYDYEELKDFCLLFKPRDNVKHLYFEFKNSLKQRLSISIDDQNPLSIRETLLKYLPEDLERTEPPISEQLAKIFKL
jgi:hypothetical protein